MSANAKSFAPAGSTTASKVRDHLDWYDFNIFGDPHPSVRFGLEYAHTIDTYVDGTRAVNQRVQFSGFFIF
jgi:hypothetical protein